MAVMRRYSSRRRCHQHEDAGGVSSALRVHVGREQDGDDEGDDREDEHEGTAGPRPVRGHAVGRQVARNQVHERGHGRRPREPEDRDGAEVVEGAEAVAQVGVGQVGEGAAVRGTTLEERLRGDEERGHDARAHQEDAHGRGRRDEEAAGVADALPRTLGIVFGAAPDERHHRHAGLEAG
jgi:hypothetical protein